MSLNLTIADCLSTRKKPSFVVKPLTRAELFARAVAETYLSLAHNYIACGDTLNAASCCIEALTLIAGVTRPFAVRDQIIDLIRAIDPDDQICGKIRMCMPYAGHDPAHSLTPSPPCKYLERLVSAHQLIEYPSDDKRFNRAYEHARHQLRSHGNVPELYVVEYRSGLSSPLNDRYFAAVPPTMISQRGPHHLTDICAVVRQ